MVLMEPGTVEDPLWRLTGFPVPEPGAGEVLIRVEVCSAWRTDQHVVFGSDRGLVGHSNGVLTAFVVKTLASLPEGKSVWAAGGRVHDRLADAGLELVGIFTVPVSVGAMTPLVSQILVETGRAGQPADRPEAAEDLPVA
jgi:NADPH:quinone reductase-like Zn-dependent oxidoreductase